MFYIRKTIETIGQEMFYYNFLGTNLYEHQGKAITNLFNTLPIEQERFSTSNYEGSIYFDFLTLRESIDEKGTKGMRLLEKVNNSLWS